MEMAHKVVAKKMSLCPKISIVIPMYNVEKYIGDCMESIARQGYESLEVICVDDGSTDGSLAVAEEWHKQHPTLDLKILQQSNKRQAAARNTAFDIAKGEYVIMLDSDDVLFDGFLITLDKYISTSEPDIVAYNVVNWYPNSKQQFDKNTTYSHPAYRSFESGKAFLDYFVKLKHWGPTGMFYIFKRTMLNEYGLRFMEGVYHEDDLFIAQLCYCAKAVVVVPELAYCYRMREGSTMHNQTIGNVMDKFTVAFALERFFQEKQDINPITKSIIFNVAANGVYSLKALRRRDLLTHEKWSLAWRNASFKRRVKLLWRMWPILLKI